MTPTQQAIRVLQAHRQRNAVPMVENTAGVWVGKKTAPGATAIRPGIRAEIRPQLRRGTWGSGVGRGYPQSFPSSRRGRLGHSVGANAADDEQAASEWAWNAVTRTSNALAQYTHVPAAWVRAELQASWQALNEARGYAVRSGSKELQDAIDTLSAATARAMAASGEGAGDAFENFWGRSPAAERDKWAEDMFWFFALGGGLFLGALVLAPAMVKATGGAASLMFTGQARVLRAGTGYVKPFAALLG